MQIVSGSNTRQSEKSQAPPSGRIAGDMEGVVVRYKVFSPDTDHPPPALTPAGLTEIILSYE